MKNYLIQATTKDSWRKSWVDGIIKFMKTEIVIIFLGKELYKIKCAYWIWDLWTRKWNYWMTDNDQILTLNFHHLSLRHISNTISELVRDALLLITSMLLSHRVRELIIINLVHLPKSLPFTCVLLLTERDQLSYFVAAWDTATSGFPPMVYFI